MQTLSSFQDGQPHIGVLSVFVKNEDDRRRLLAVIPSAGYEAAFHTLQALDHYRCLKRRSTEIIEMPFAQPTEEAYWAAGRRVVDLADEMLAVWDGKKSGGLGGTGDVVAFAREQGVPVTVIWPMGSSRA